MKKKFAPAPAVLPLLLGFISLLGGCAVGPDYQRPAQTIPPQYKEAQGWQAAAPADALPRGAWWQVFQDPTLNALEDQLGSANQDIAAAVAAYDQAAALAGVQQAAFFPTVALDVGATRTGAASATSGTSSNTGTGTDISNNYRASLDASWDIDVWGRLRRLNEAGQATAQASAADLAAARLSAQGALASSYFSLRQTDAQKTLQDQTVAGYQRDLQITQNRYAAGTAAKTDVLQAQTQLLNAQASAAQLAQQRAQLEHAIAVLLGKTPAEFSLPPAPWQMHVPSVPLAQPSTLLQRRPDIAGAERRVAAANAQIGVAKAAYFPSLSLSASDGFSASAASQLLHASSGLWSFGIALSESLFSAGANTATLHAARAAHAQAVANYRKTVLAAFQNVEDQLSTTRSLGQQASLRLAASQAATETQTRMMNQYKAGQIDYSQVVAAQVSAWSAQSALIQTQAGQQIAAVALIQALGGSWAAQTPSTAP